MLKKGKLAPRKSFLEHFIVWGIVIVFAVLPVLYFPGRVGSYVTSKQYFLIGTVDLLAIAWAWLLLADARYRLSKKNLFYLVPLFLFLVFQTVSAIFGVDPATSFFSKVESGTGLILLYHAFFLTCIVASILRVQQKKLLTYILQANAFASAILAGMTFFTGHDGVWDIASEMLNKSTGGATMGNSLLAGAYFIFSVFFVLYLAKNERKIYKKAIYFTVIALIIFSPIFFSAAVYKGAHISSPVLLIGEARIAAVSLIGGLLISLFLWLSLQKGRKGTRIVGIAGLVLGIFVLLGGIQQLATAGTPLNSFLVAQSGNRITDWKESVQGIQEKPLLGWGPENFHVVYQKFLDPIVFAPGHGNEVWALHPHNNTLEVLVNGGILSFLAYLVTLAVLFTGIVRLYKKEILDSGSLALFTGMLIAFILQQQMIYDSIVSYVMLFLVVAIVSGLNDTTDMQKPLSPLGQSAVIAGIVISIAMIPVWLYGSYFPARKMEEFQSIAEAHSDIRAVLYEHMFHSAGSYAINTDIEFYTDSLYFSYDSEKEALKSNPLYRKVASEEFTALFKAIEPLQRKNPQDYHLLLSLAQLKNLQFYLTDDRHQLDDAKKYIEYAEVLSPTDPQIHTTHGEVYERMGNIETARKEAQIALALSPSYVPAQNLLKDLK